MMSGIRGQNTKPELLVRKGLHAMGFRYRLGVRDVSGKPDMVFPRRRAAVFVHGCFWHGHDCALFQLPGTRTEFWAAKIDRNRARDGEVSAALQAAQWRQLIIWECAIRGRHRIGLDAVLARAAAWLRGSEPFSELRGAA